MFENRGTAARLPGELVYGRPTYCSVKKEIRGQLVLKLLPELLAGRPCAHARITRFENTRIRLCLGPEAEQKSMAIARQVITSLLSDGTDMLGTKSLAVKIADENIVSGSLLTVESNHFCVLKSRGAVLNVYETGQYALTTPDKPLLGSIAQGFFGGSSPWVYEVIYVNRSKLLIRSEGVATSEEMAEMAYQVDYYIHVDTKEAALALITH